MHIYSTLALFAALSAGSLAVAATYHVSPQGNDANPGTLDKPLATIQAAADRMNAGDVCIILEGTYRETVRPARSGSADAPIRFIAGRSASPLITGTDLVANWSVHKQKIYKAPLAEAPQQVFCDGQILIPARFPNAGDDLYKPSTVALVADKANIRGEALDQFPKDYWKGGVLWGIDDRLGWVAQSRKIVSSEPGSVTVDSPKAWYSAGTGRAYLSGVLAALDAPGEWHWQDGTLYVWTPTSNDPGSHRIEATRRRFAFDLSGLSHIDVSGLGIFAASVNLDNAESCRLGGLNVTWPCVERDIPGGFNRDRGISMQAQGLGIILAGKNNAITNSIVAHSTGDGISIWGQDNVVENCIVHNCDYAGADNAPITVTGVGHIIRRNTLYNGGRSILVHRKLQKGRIEHNHMYNAGLMTNDLGMTYTYQTDGQGTVIAYNLIHHNFGRGYGCVGIYLDDMSSNHIVHHNLVYQVSESIALNPPKSLNNLVYNNTLVAFRQSIGMSTKRPQDLSGSRFFNNICTGRIPTTMPNATVGNNILKETDPKFVAPEKFDFRLSPDSPAVDAGAPLPPYTDGFAGNAPDCGALERGKEPWTAGSTLRPPQDIRDVDLSIAARQWDEARKRAATQPTTAQQQ